MKRQPRVESLENRQLLTSLAGDSDNAVGYMATIVDDSSIYQAETANFLEGDPDRPIITGLIYHGEPANGARHVTNNETILVGVDRYEIVPAENAHTHASNDMILKGKKILEN